MESQELPSIGDVKYTFFEEGVKLNDIAASFSKEALHHSWKIKNMKVLIVIDNDYTMHLQLPMHSLFDALTKAVNQAC